MTTADPVVRVFDELFRLRPATLRETKWFDGKRHNDDLCPAFERQSDAVLGAFQRFRRFAHDTQGLRDRGIDVIVRWDDDEKYLIGLQIKAKWDLEQDDYLSRLKAQAYEAMQDHGALLRAYYIVLCVPPDKGDGKHPKTYDSQVRAIKGEFRTADRVLVIDPKNALAFLNHGSGRIDVTIENSLREDDPLREEARNRLVSLPPTQAGLALVCAAMLMAPDTQEPSLAEIERSSFIRRLYEAVPDIPRYAFTDGAVSTRRPPRRRIDDRQRSLSEQLAEDIDALLGGFLELRADTRYRANHEAVAPLLALLYDAHVRLGLERGKVAEYVYHLLEIPQLFGLELDLSVAPPDD